MTELVYRGDRQRPDGAERESWAEIFDEIRPDLYQPSAAMVSAVNVALLLGRTLLLTGEPGTGKTHLALAVAWELGLAPPLVFDTRSTSEAKNLFYSFDALGRLHESTSRAKSDGPGSVVAATPYIDLEALGRAIVLSRPLDDSANVLTDRDLALRARGRIPGTGPVRSVVLVDEIDKAPRDFPNDLLGALDRMEFRMPEARVGAVKAARQFRPIVVATSNSENVLPEPFLRRCIYHHVEFPDAKALTGIVTSRTGAWAERILRRELDAALVGSVMRLFEALRREDLRKPPATAELIEWVMTIHARPDSKGGKLTEPAVFETIGVVVKREDDLKRARDVLAREFASTGKAG